MCFLLSLPCICMNVSLCGASCRLYGFALYVHSGPLMSPSETWIVQGNSFALTELLIKHRHSLECHPAVLKGARLIQNHRQLPDHSTKWDMEDNMTGPGTTQTTLQESILMHKFLFLPEPTPSVLLICIQSLICKICKVKPAPG